MRHVRLSSTTHELYSAAPEFLEGIYMTEGHLVV